MKGAPHALVGRYAMSLFKAAIEQKALDAVRQDVTALSAALHEHREFALLVMNPNLGKQRLRRMLEALCAKVSAHTITLNFVHLLLDKDRLDVLFNIGPVFEKMWRDQQGLVDVTVTTAVEIGEPLQKAISDHLAKTSRMTPVVAWKTDPRILGGIIVQWPERVFDGSLVRKVAGLQEKLAGR